MVALAAAAVIVPGIGARPASVAAEAAPVLTVVSSMDNVRPDASVVDTGRSAALVAARNDTESFQIVVAGPASQVSVSGDLFGWGSTMLYRVGYYNALQESDHEGGKGLWGDALIPDRDNIYHERRNAFPFDVAAGKNQAVWVDVAVPASVPAGFYHDVLTVTSAVGTSSVRVSIEVLDWTLPVTSSLRSAFYMVYNQGSSELCKAHFPSDPGNNCRGDITALRTLHQLYTRIALDDRVTIANGSGLNAAQSPASGDPSGQWESLYESPIIRGDSTIPSTATWRLPGAQATAVSQFAYTNYDCDAPCATGWKNEATELGQDFSSKFIWYACDEPGANPTNWTNCGTNFAPVHVAWPAKALITAPLQQYNARPLGSPAAQVLVVISQYMDGKPDYGYVGNQRPLYDAFLATPGNEVWLYSACDGYSCDSSGSDAAVYDGWPGYAVDAPAVQSRAQSWMDFKFDVTGDLYWAVDQSLRTAWADGGLYAFGGNGDGTLFYPGRPAVIGGTTDIPIESIRLKRIRDGREDYEYMKRLSDLGRSADARAVVNSVFPHLFDAVASKDGSGPGSLLAGREQLLQVFRSTLAPQPSPTEGRIVFSSDRDGDDELFTMKPDGTDQRQLTTNTVADRFPAWSPSGSLLAWAEGPDVLVGNLVGGRATIVTSDISDVSTKPAWTSDGASIVFVRMVGGQSQLWAMSANGAEKHAVVVPTGDVIGVYDPVVTADGRLVYSAKHAGGRVDLLIADLSGANPRPMDNVNGPSTTNEVAAESDTSGLFAFSRSVAGAPYDVVVVAPHNGTPRIVSTEAGSNAADDFDAAWALDGSAIAYVSNVGGDTEIWRVSSTGSGAVALTANGGSDLDPDWAAVGVPTPITEPPLPTPITEPPVPLRPSDFVGFQPARIMDSRVGGVTIDGQYAAGGLIPADTVVALAVGGRADVPTDALAAVLNVTVTEPAAAGFLTIFPCGASRPTTSNLNYDSGQTVPNAVVSLLGTGGQLCVFSQRPTHLVVDVSGYFPSGNRYRPLVPARLLDTRAGQPTIDGLHAGRGAIGGGTSYRLDVAGRGGVSATAAAVVVNVTSVNGIANGYVTVYPCDAVPNASNLNVAPGGIVPNAVIAALDLTGGTCIYASASTDIVVDVSGEFPSNAGLTVLQPRRLLDTRAGYTTIDGIASGGPAIVHDQPLAVQIAGRGGVPASARSVVLNLTVTGPLNTGYLTVYPCDQSPPTASNLNFVPGQTVANLAVVRLSGDGRVCAYSNATTHLVIDVVGAFP